MQGIRVFSFPPSQEFSSCPFFQEAPEGLRLVFDQEGPTGRYELRGLLFKGVLSYKCTRWAATEEWMVEAYDTLWEMKGSTWLTELRAMYSGQAPFEHKHYAVFFDDYGFYEVIASSFVQIDL